MSAVLIIVALGTDKLKERVLCSRQAGARTRETDAIIVCMMVAKWSIQIAMVYIYGCKCTCSK